MSFAARHNQAKTVGQVIGDAVWKRSGISATMGWIQKFRLLILGLPGGIRNKTGKKARLDLDRGHQSLNSDDLHHPFHVVGKNMQAHFGTDSLQGSGQEMRGPHPILQGAERMLNSLSSRPHRFRFFVEAFLHCFQARFIFPTSNPPIGARRTFLLHRAAGAIGAPVFMDQRSPVDG